MGTTHKHNIPEQFVKLICIAGFIILLIGLIKEFLVDSGLDLTKWEKTKIITQIENIFTMLLFTIIFFNPKKVEFLALASFIYTVAVILEENVYNVMEIFMFYLTVSLLIFRGFYHHKKTLKIVFTIFVILGLYLTKLRYGFDNYLESMFQAAGYSLVLFCILFFLMHYQKNKSFSSLNTRILDLSDYDENQLSAMDKEWLELALTNEKYNTIARKYGYSEGHVKNRMHYIFATIDVIDRIDLFSKYAGCKVIKDKEELQQWKQDILGKS